MNTRDLGLFLDVARRGSFAAVAKARGMDPSAVSRAIAGLETDLGVRLFQRSTRRMRLTEAGELFLTRAAPLAEELERARADALAVRANPTGTLRMTASVTFGQRCIVPNLGAFRRCYPDVRVDAVFTDANLDLVDQGIDLAVRLAPMVTGDVIATKLMSTAYRVVASPGYVRSAPPIQEPRDLARHRCLLFPLPGYRSQWRFRDRAGDIEEVPIAGDLTLAPAGSLRDAALDGLGPALLADWLVDDDIAAGRLVRLLPDHAVTATSFDTAAWLLYPSRSFLPAKVRVMIDFLRARLGAGANAGLDQHAAHPPACRAT